MIDVYSWPTPNGHKVHIMLEETGLQYRVHGVNIREGEQFKPEFLKVSPNNRIPAIVDPDGPNGKPISLFESGAILLYLASKTGKLLPADMHCALELRAMADVADGRTRAHDGAGQSFPPLLEGEDPVRHRPLHQRGEPADGRARQAPGRGALYRRQPNIRSRTSRAFPWMRGAESRGVNIAEYPNVKRWFDEINARPAVQRALQGASRSAGRQHGAPQRQVVGHHVRQIAVPEAVRMNGLLGYL